MINILKSYLTFSRKLVGVVSTTMAVALLVIYIGTVNGVATAGFEVSNIEKEIAMLKKDRANLQLEVSAVGSLQRVETELRSLSLSPVTEIEYLNTASSVAVR
jgi:hypothetical protein